MKKVFASSALFLLFAGAVQAGPLLDFYIPTQASSTPLLSYAGGTAPVIASGLAVQSVTGNETSLNNGTALSITGGTMNFTSGNFVGTANGNWNFASGGSFSVTGGISAIGVANGSSLLFNGTFDGPVSVQELGGNFRLLGTAVLSDVNPTLATYFGLPSNSTYSGGLSLLFVAPGNAGDPFSASQVAGGDVGTSAVPEPASLALLSIGSLSLIGFGWRVRQAKK